MTTTVEFINKLRNSGLRPTKQRIKICEVLFNKETTFHFTINDLVKIIETEANEKISLATVYNTIHAFEKKGYLKEIPIDSNQSYFDTNVTDHHHFYDISEKKLIDLDEVDVGPINIQKSIPGKKIKSVEVLVKLDTDNQ
jgi:Fur family iron response transcriptional regulator|tara:strand:+ start:234 stop:653 length:420 start_codon:yes stop_codon:yes gene_type:complete